MNRDMENLKDQGVKQRIIAILYLLKHKEESVNLSDYVGSQYKESLEKQIQAVKLEKDLEFSLKEEVKKLRAQEDFSRIASIHPAWFLESLKKESPRVIGVLLRHLPTKHVQYLINHLPKRIVDKLPNALDSFCIPKVVLNLIRRRFERQFIFVPPEEEVEEFNFSKLYYLKNEELQLLFRELGLSELALALASSSKKVVEAILNRFPVTDAKVLVERIKESRKSSNRECLEARYTILELTNQQLGVEAFLQEVGIAALSKAFSVGEDFLFQALKQKLEPTAAYLLKRYIDQHVQLVDMRFIKSRRKLILEQINKLSSVGRIDPKFARYLSAAA